MRAEIRSMLERQADWQRSRKEKPWAQKLRESLVMRRAQRSLRSDTPNESGSGEKK